MYAEQPSETLLTQTAAKLSASSLYLLLLHIQYLYLHILGRRQPFHAPPLEHFSLTVNSSLCEDCVFSIIPVIPLENKKFRYAHLNEINLSKKRAFSKVDTSSDTPRYLQISAVVSKAPENILIAKVTHEHNLLNKKLNYRRKPLNSSSVDENHTTSKYTPK